MQGGIYSTNKCSICRSTLKYKEGRGYFECPQHPLERCSGRSIVRFGRKHTKRFATVVEAERHLNYIRVLKDRGEYDHRFWNKEQPLSFRALRKSFVEAKGGTEITAKQVVHIAHVLKVAGRRWDDLQIKDITETEIEDFLRTDHGIGSKTRSNWKSALTDFWAWVVRRERRKSVLEMPEFPQIRFKMKMKKVLSVQQQQKIIEEVRRISWQKNPRIWLAIKLLSLYPRVRPAEMVNVQESDINLDENWIVFPDPKEQEPKYIHLLQEHANLIADIRGMEKADSSLYFFRHVAGVKGTKEGVQFGPKYLNVWWKRACKNLDIEGVALYAGTKHSTVTALGKHMSPEEIKHNVTGHTSKAFERYFLPDMGAQVKATEKVAKMQEDAL